MPAYIQDLAPFEVRYLEGAYAPTNGTSDLESVTPSEWLTSDPGTGMGVRGVIDAWSGGAKTTTGTTLYVFGGGHNDSANNGVYGFDFAGTTAPTGWTLHAISAVSAAQNAETYSDGRPSSRHTYDGLFYHDGFMYAMGGSPFQGGGFSSTMWKFEFATSSWANVGTYPGSAGAFITIFDPVSGKAFITEDFSSIGYFFDTADDSWSISKSFSGAQASDDNIGAWDSSRGRGVYVGEGQANALTINFSAETVSGATLSASGATGILSEAAQSMAYDPLLDCFWIWGGKDDSAGWANLYRMDADTFAITQHALSTDMSAGMPADFQGSFGRFLFRSDWRAILTVNQTDEAAVVIRLPSA